MSQTIDKSTYSRIYGHGRGWVFSPRDFADLGARPTIDQQAHRKKEMPSRYLRHYYDLYRLAASAVKERALSDVKLLEDVVAFKSCFYPSAWARYDLAKPGSFRLIPNQSLK